MTAGRALDWGNAQSLPGAAALAMPPSLSVLAARWGARDFAGWLQAVPIAALVGSHLTAFVMLTQTEIGLEPKAIFLLTWLLLNFLWLALLRRPAMAATLSLGMIATLVALSQFKFDKLLMTLNFVDVMVLDPDSIRFFLTIYPRLGQTAVLLALTAIPILMLIWRFDRFRLRLRHALAGTTLTFAGVAGLCATSPMAPHEAFFSDGYVSKFVRSGADAITAFVTQGFMESDAHASGSLAVPLDDNCELTARPPHIVLVLDESSFDMRAAPGVKLPPDYGRHFRSFDGKQRSFVVEGVGGPTWYAEYNVLTGLSVRSYGRFSYFVTRIAAGRVERGLPKALRRCGYHTFTLYPTAGAFMSARSFQTTVGVEHFLDTKSMGTTGIEPDRFFYDQTAKVIARERAAGPLFIFTYLAANHFPWDERFRPELTPNWRNPGNAPNVDEYLRRQNMSEQDYADFTARLKRDFPGEQFLIVRFGDHQPEFAERIIDPVADEQEIARRLQGFDRRYLTSYYAIDAINFTPRNLSSALERLEAPYLPLVIQEAAGLPLDPSFREQKKILVRCQGLFFLCAGGAEARRFNRLLIDAGLIKHL